MRTLSVLGIILIVLGALGLTYEGLSYTSRKQVIDVGPLQASVQQEKHIQVPPILSGAVILVGIGLMLAGTKKKT